MILKLSILSIRIILSLVHSCSLARAVCAFASRCPTLYQFDTLMPYCLLDTPDATACHLTCGLATYTHWRPPIGSLACPGLRVRSQTVAGFRVHCNIEQVHPLISTNSATTFRDDDPPSSLLSPPACCYFSPLAESPLSFFFW